MEDLTLKVNVSLYCCLSETAKRVTIYYNQLIKNNWQKVEEWLHTLEGGIGELLKGNGYRVSVLDDKKILEMDSGDVSTMTTVSIPLNCT